MQQDPIQKQGSRAPRSGLHDMQPPGCTPNLSRACAHPGDPALVAQTLGTDQQTIRVDMPLLIDCSFCAATGMIAYGAVIGKATPTQLMWMMVALVRGPARGCAVQNAQPQLGGHRIQLLLILGHS